MTVLDWLKGTWPDEKRTSKDQKKCPRFREDIYSSPINRLKSFLIASGAGAFLVELRRV
jgi:hypothetical protein